MTMIAPKQLRFWRPFPREVADIICGEGTVDELPVRTHDALQVILPASRFRMLDGRGGSSIVDAGQVCVAAPLELHGARSLGNDRCVIRVLLVSPHLIPGLALSRIPSVIVDDAALYAELWALIDDLRGPLVSLACAPRLVSALRRLVTVRMPQNAEGSQLSVGRRGVGVARVRDHLRQHFTESISLDELASVAELSKFFLLRAFQRAYGITPHAYQMQLRLGHVWRLIVDGSPLSRATYDAGFADQSHLTRRFASVFGLTPARYVRQLALSPGAERSAWLGAETRASRSEAAAA